MTLRRLLPAVLASAALSACAVAPAGAGQPLLMTARKGVALPPGLLRSLPLEQGVTYAFSSCTDGRGGFLFMHTQGRPGHSAEAAVTALLRGEREKASELLEFQVQADNVRGGGPESRLLHTRGARHSVLDEGDAALELFERFPVLALRCRSEVPEIRERQFDALQATVLQGLVLKAGRAQQEFSSREAAQARYRELTKRALELRDASSGRHVLQASGREEEALSWVAPGRSVEVELSGAPGKPWRLQVQVLDERPIPVRVAR